MYKSKTERKDYMDYQNHSPVTPYQSIFVDQVSRFIIDGRSRIIAGDGGEQPSLPSVHDAPATILTEEQADGTIESVIAAAAPSRHFDKKHGLGWLPTWKVEVDGVLIVIVDVHQHKPGYVSIQRWNGNKWISRHVKREADFFPLDVAQKILEGEWTEMLRPSSVVNVPVTAPPAEEEQEEEEEDEFKWKVCKSDIHQLSWNNTILGYLYCVEGCGKKPVWHWSTQIALYPEGIFDYALPDGVSLYVSAKIAKWHIEHMWLTHGKEKYESSQRLVPTDEEVELIVQATERFVWQTENPLRHNLTLNGCIVCNLTADDCHCKNWTLVLRSGVNHYAGSQRYFNTTLAEAKRKAKEHMLLYHKEELRAALSAPPETAEVEPKEERPAKPSGKYVWLYDSLRS